MAVVAEQILSPRGEVEAAVLFPDETYDDVVERIEGYITAAEAKAPGNDAAIEAWTYYRAFSAVADRMATQAMQATLPEGGSYQYLVAQVKAMRDRAESFRAEYNAAILPASAASGWGVGLVVRGS